VGALVLAGLSLRVLLYLLMVYVATQSVVRITYSGKAILVTGRGGPQGFQRLRLSHFLDNRLADGGEVVSLTRRPPGRFLVLISVRG
jgi:hypothetical protein